MQHLGAAGRLSGMKFRYQGDLVHRHWHGRATIWPLINGPEGLRSRSQIAPIRPGSGCAGRALQGRCNGRGRGSRKRVQPRGGGGRKVVRREVARIMGVGAALIAALTVTLGIGPATATAAPKKPPAPTTIAITST